MLRWQFLQLRRGLFQVLLLLRWLFGLLLAGRVLFVKVWWGLGLTLEARVRIVLQRVLSFEVISRHLVIISHTSLLHSVHVIQLRLCARLLCFHLRHSALRSLYLRRLWSLHCHLIMGCLISCIHETIRLLLGLRFQLGLGRRQGVLGLWLQWLLVNGYLPYVIGLSGKPQFLYHHVWFRLLCFSTPSFFLKLLDSIRIPQSVQWMLTTTIGRGYIRYHCSLTVASEWILQHLGQLAASER